MSAQPLTANRDHLLRPILYTRYSILCSAILAPMPSLATSAGTVEKAPKAEKKEYTAEEKNACSIEAMRNGGTCEACQ